MKRQAELFATDGIPIFCAPFGQGHINETYLMVDSVARQYIMQRINDTVFTDPAALMKNIELVTGYLARRTDDPRRTMCLVAARGGGYIVRDEGWWRMYDFVSDTVCLQTPRSERDFYESAVAFGDFQAQLKDFDASALSETIPRFHDTPDRYAKLRAAAQADAMSRVQSVSRELDFAFSRADYADTLEKRRAEGELPTRVTHNDTKLNNVLLDRHTGRAMCVIDLDTVMPGLSVNDFGDSIRFGASTAAEDEQDLSRVSMSLELYEAYMRGFLAGCAGSLTQAEIESLCDGAKMMTLECGVRFLTDYLNGDVYFKIHRPDHNLDRCRTQFKLVADMEDKWDKMRALARAGVL